MTNRKLYTLFSFHKREAYHFSVVDRNGNIFDKFNIPEYRNNEIRNNIIPLKEEFIEEYKLNLDDFLNQYDLYTCYSGTGDLFSEKAVNLLQNELKDEIKFIPCSLNGEKVKLYAALLLKSAAIISEQKGKNFEFYPTTDLNAEYAMQDENSAVKFVTQKFVDLVEKHRLKIEFKAR